MRTLLAISIVCLVFASIEGCASFHARSVTIAWQSDGNPELPVCPAPGQFCKSSVEILDLTTGQSVKVPVTAPRYLVEAAALDVYQGRTVGLDATGNAIASNWEPVAGTAGGR
jgi:hypothetical protein